MDDLKINPPISDRIPASSFYKTPITFLFSPSFEKDSNLISALVDTLYTRSDLAGNRLNSDLMDFTIQNNTLNRDQGIEFQGFFFKIELDSQLIANDLITHFLNKQADGSFNFDKVLECTNLVDDTLTRKDLEQISSLVLSRHLLIVFDLDESGNHKKRIIAHLFGLKFDDNIPEYFFKNHWISSEDSDSIKTSRQKYFRLYHYRLNWIKSYRSTSSDTVNIHEFLELQQKIDDNAHGIPQVGLPDEFDPITSEMDSHVNLHTGQKFTAYRTGFTKEINRDDTVSRILLEKEGDLYVKKVRKQGTLQHSTFYQKGRVNLDSSMLLVRKSSGGIGFFIGYEAGFQKVNQDQLSFQLKNGGVPFLGLEFDLSKYLSKGLKINVPHSIHLFARFSHSLYFNYNYKDQVINYLSSITQNGLPVELNPLDASRIRDILEIKKSEFRVGLSKDFYLTSTWYLTPYMGLGFGKISPIEWPKFPSTSDNFPFRVDRNKYDYYELFIGNPAEFNDDVLIVHYHNLQDDLATQQDYFLGLRLSAVLGLNIHATGYFEAIKRNTQWQSDVAYYMPGMFIIEEHGTRVGISIKYEF